MKEIFKETLPILEKAAPILCNALFSDKNKPVGTIICGLLSAIFGGHPLRPNEVARKLSDDPDLYAKLNKLEESHKDWILNLHN